MVTELLLKAASAFINCCVVRESKVSSYDAHLPLFTKSCVPYPTSRNQTDHQFLSYFNIIQIVQLYLRNQS